MKKVLLAMLVMVSSIAWAQDVPSKPEAEGQQSKEMGALRMAGNLIRYGYSEQQAMPLLDALYILSSVQTQESNEKKQRDNGEKPTPKDNKVSFDVHQIIADAKTFADGDENILALIATVEQDLKPHRGAVGGPKRHVDYVNGHSYDTYSCSFVKGRLAEVGLSGDGDTDLDLYVYDSNGNLIASDTDYSDDCYVRWVPKWTGRYTIKIVNRGPVYNQYIILTN